MQQLGGLVRVQGSEKRYPRDEDHPHAFGRYWRRRPWGASKPEGVQGRLCIRGWKKRRKTWYLNQGFPCEDIMMNK